MHHSRSVPPFPGLLSRAFLVRFGADLGSDAEGGHIHASLLLRYFFGWVAQRASLSCRLPCYQMRRVREMSGNETGSRETGANRVVYLVTKK